jgi:hypothetical protein
MNASVYVGLCVCAHNNSALCTSTFSNVSISSLNVPPVVTLSCPQAGEIIDAPAAITLDATASSSDSTIAKVEFYNGTTLVGTATASPYTFTWSNVAAGNCQMTAKAYDNVGLTAVSSAVSATVISSTPPSVALTTVTLEGTLSATGCNIASVTVNGVPATFTNTTWQQSVFVQAGTNIFTIKVTDQAGNVTTKEVQIVN